MECVFTVFDNCRNANTAFPQVILLRPRIVSLACEVQLRRLYALLRVTAVITGEDDNGIIFFPIALILSSTFTGTKPYSC